jgi:hypothetical protein
LRSTPKYQDDKKELNGQQLKQFYMHKIDRNLMLLFCKNKNFM